jgi:hypothetical protein
MDFNTYGDADCRKHCENAGRDYEEYRPAYLMGWELGAGGRFGAWDQAEPHVRRLWNDQQFGRPWTAKEANEAWRHARTSAKWAFERAKPKAASVVQQRAS